MLKMNSVKRLLGKLGGVSRWLALLASIMLFIGCAAGPGVITQMTMPNGEVVTRITHKSPPSWMLRTSELKLNFQVKGREVTDTQFAVVSAVEKAGRKYVKEVRPNDLVSILSNAVPRTIGGYAGGYLGSKAFPGADPQQYGEYTALVTLFASITNDLLFLGGKTYPFEFYGMQTLDGMYPVYGIKVLIKTSYP